MWTEEEADEGEEVDEEEGQEEELRRGKTYEGC